MADIQQDILEFHWALQVMNDMDSGLVIVDKNFQVFAWNSFMRSYSGVATSQVMGKDLFSVFPDLPEEWLRAKVDAAIRLKTRGFSSWEDRAYLFKFSNFSPVSNGLAVMYQNVVFTPLKSLEGEVTHVGMMIHDVSDTAKKKLHLKESNKELSKLSRTDGLTGLFNRSHWENCLQDQYIKCTTIGQHASLVMFDIDHFKKVNDEYGHLSGDQVIKHAAQELLRTARQADICGRYGGEEFAVILPNTSSDQALYFAERLRKRILAAKVSTDGQQISYTISLGICEFSNQMISHCEWLENVDKALYVSKQSGRNVSSIFQ